MITAERQHQYIADYAVIRYDKRRQQDVILWRNAYVTEYLYNSLTQIEIIQFERIKKSLGTKFKAVITG